MSAAKGDAVRIAPLHVAPMLMPLLSPVMTGLAQRLQVALVKEQCDITFVWGDVIHHSGSRDALCLLA